MENASKALIIAGAILLAILVISLGVMIFNNIGGTARNMANMDKQEIASFNSKITPYLGNSVTGTQVNALLQYCLSNNMAAKKSGETNKYITVIVNPTGETLNEDKTSYTRVTTGSSTYRVNGTYDDNGLLTTITVN